MLLSVLKQVFNCVSGSLAAGDLRYRVDHTAYKDHVCFGAVCRRSVLLALSGLLGNLFPARQSRSVRFKCGSVAEIGLPQMIPKDFDVLAKGPCLYQRRS